MKNIKNTSSLRTIISVLMVLLMLFLPLSSWSSDIMLTIDKESESFIVLYGSDSKDNTVPCHSKDTEMARSSQGIVNGDCCGQTGMHTQCDNCEYNCTFVKHFSSFIDSFTIGFSSTQLVLRPVEFIATQFPVPPFRPPAA
tara:strand:+ start:106 stop:528 length:423 start_codon:yes stop_codon:yes gene_type:complete